MQLDSIESHLKQRKARHVRAVQLAMQRLLGGAESLDAAGESRAVFSVELRRTLFDSPLPLPLQLPWCVKLAPLRFRGRTNALCRGLRRLATLLP